MAAAKELGSSEQGKCPARSMVTRVARIRLYHPQGQEADQEAQDRTRRTIAGPAGGVGP